MLLGALVLALWLSPHRAPPVSVDPLAIDPHKVAAASLDGAALPQGSPAFTAAAGLPRRLVGLRAAAPMSWVEPRMLRLDMRDGATLWLQLMRIDGSVVVRVNADAGPRASPSEKTRIDELRALRLRAYRLPGDSLLPILGEIAGSHGVAINLGETNRLIHKNKTGRRN